MEHLSIPAGLYSNTFTNLQSIPINHTNQVISDDHFDKLLQTHDVTSKPKSRKKNSNKSRRTKKIRTT